jgi:hypothetical protein
MQRLPGLSAALALCVSTAAFANAHKEAPMIPSAPASAAQAKAGECSKKAAGRTGDAREAFMKACLAADAPMSQQDQTRKCEAQAAGKTGDARKAFLQTCLAT